MADHDAVCAASGLTIGYTNIRVVLLAESDHLDYGINGRFYPLGPALRASWNRDAGRPVEWKNDTAYRLIHDLFKEGLSEGRRRSMPEILEQMPGGLTMRRIYARPREHPDSYRIKRRRARAAPWVPTCKRVLRILEAGGIKAYTNKVAYGIVKVQAPRPNYEAVPEEWYTKATELLYVEGYYADRCKDPTYGDSLTVSPSSVELTLEDVRVALSSGGWPEVDKSVPTAEEPVFKEETWKISEKATLNLSTAKQEETWKLFDATHGFEVVAADGGFLVFHCVNGVQTPDAKSLDHYYSRLRAQGIDCRPLAYNEHGFAQGCISVPGQVRSFQSLVTQRRLRYLENRASRYKASRHFRRRRVVTWALIREDVWQKLLATKKPKGWHKDDDGTFETEKINTEKAFKVLVEKAREELNAKERNRHFETIEHTLAALPRDFVVEHAVYNDPPFRVGIKWTFVHLAVLYAKGEISETERKEALNAFAEYRHVEKSLAYLTQQWKLPHTGHQERFYEITAKVYSDWAKLAKADLVKD